LFKQTTENEIDFCESYKSQILGQEEEEKAPLFGTALKLVTILILLALIILFSLYGYHYFVKDKASESSIVPPVSLQVSEDETISDEDLVVKLEEPESNKVVQPSVSKEVKEAAKAPIIKKVEKVVQRPVVKEIEVPKEEPKVEKVIELPVTKEQVEVPKVEKIIEAQAPKVVTQESDIEKMANAIKIEIAKREKQEEERRKEKEKLLDRKKSEASLEVPSTPSALSPEAKYLEELADLSKEIDKEENE